MSCDERTRSCVRRRLFSLRRSSTADRSDGGLRRCAWGQIRGRAHLQGPADSPVDLLRTQGSTGRSHAPAATCYVCKVLCTRQSLCKTSVLLSTSMAIPPQLQRKTEPAGPRWVYTPRVRGNPRSDMIQVPRAEPRAGAAAVPGWASRGSLKGCSRATWYRRRARDRKRNQETLSSAWRPDTACGLRTRDNGAGATARRVSRKCGRYGNEVDHIQPLDRGGEAYAPSNLQVLCRGCHIQSYRYSASRFKLDNLSNLLNFESQKAQLELFHTAP